MSLNSRHDERIASTFAPYLLQVQISKKVAALDINAATRKHNCLFDKANR